MQGSSELDSILVQSMTMATANAMFADQDTQTQAQSQAQPQQQADSDPEWKLVRRTKGEDGEWWSSSPAAGLAQKRMFGVGEEASELEVAHAAFSRGFSLVVNHLENKYEAAARLAMAFEEELGARTGINLYFTPRDSQAFEAHFDWMDAFVLQVEGSKRWRLYDALVEQPRPDMKFKPRQEEIEEAFIDFVLEPGDLLYLPSGLIHEAMTDRGEGGDAAGGAAPPSHSLHLTVGVETTVLGSWESLLLVVLMRGIMPGCVCDVQGDDKGAELRAMLARPVPSLEGTFLLTLGDVAIVTLVHLATQERALRRPVPLTPLMKWSSSSGAVGKGNKHRRQELGKMATLLREKGNVDAAWKDLVQRHNGSLPRSLSFGLLLDEKAEEEAKEAPSSNNDLGLHIQERISRAAHTLPQLPQTISTDISHLLQCVQTALHNKTQAKATLTAFEKLTQKDLRARQEARMTKLQEVGIWQASIGATEGQVEGGGPQIFAVGGGVSGLASASMS